jgi:transposase
MGKRIYSPEFRREAIRRANEPGVTLSQVAREIGIKQQTLHRWKTLEGKSSGEPAGKPNAQNTELERLRRENARLRAERDILKKRSATSPRNRREVRLHSEASGGMADPVDVRGARCFAKWVLRVGWASAQCSCAAG